MRHQKYCALAFVNPNDIRQSDFANIVLGLTHDYVYVDGDPFIHRRPILILKKDALKHLAFTLADRTDEASILVQLAFCKLAIVATDLFLLRGCKPFLDSAVWWGTF